MDSRNRYLQQKLSSNRTLPIITTTIEPQIDDMVVTCRGTFHGLATPTTKRVITDVARSSVWVPGTTGNVIRTGLDGTNLCD